MNKNGKTTTIILILLVLGLIIYLGIAYGYVGSKTLAEHAEPADISESEEGKGIEVLFRDKEGNPVEIPDWFKVAESTGVVGAIVSHPPAPSCSVGSDCPGFGVNPNIACWESSCVLTNIADMKMIVKVTNGAAFTFNNVYITSAGPPGFSNALPIGQAYEQTLISSGIVSWDSEWMNIEGEGWVGTTQPFSANVRGESSYDASVETSSDSISLAFGADPTGSFSVMIESGVPQ